MTPKPKRGRPRKHPLPTGAATDYRQPFVDRDVAPGPPGGEKVTVPLDSEGRIDFEQFQSGGQLGRLRDAIAADPKAPEQLGIKPATADGSETAPLVTEDHARALYSALNDIFGFTLAKRTQLPRAEIQQVIGYTEAEYQKMCPLTSRVLNRHLPARTLAFQEISLLCAELWEIHQRKLLQLTEYVRKRAEDAQRAAGPVNGGIRGNIEVMP